MVKYKVEEGEVVPELSLSVLSLRSRNHFIRQNNWEDLTKVSSAMDINENKILFFFPSDRSEKFVSNFSNLWQWHIQFSKKKIFDYIIP